MAVEQDMLVGATSRTRSDASNDTGGARMLAEATLAAAGLLVPPMPVAQRKVQGPRGAATRARIIAAARAVLANASIGSISARAIAERADIARPTFYLYFDDIDHLMLELAEKAGEPFRVSAVTLQAALDRGLPLAQWVHAAVKAFLDSWQQDPQPLMFRNLAVDRGDKRFFALWSQAMAPWLSMVMQQKLQHGPETSPAEALIEAGMILSMCQHFATQAATSLIWRSAAFHDSLVSVATRMLGGPSR